ncbi:hypothetical protein AgCh_027082 [Apium graveolens]
MASDVLSIPISTVASESTFSAGGRVIEPHRSCLKPGTVEVLLCGADWVRELYGLKKLKQELSSIMAEEQKVLSDGSTLDLFEDCTGFSLRIDFV